jgi:DNA-binding transcriptional regulator YiaG
VPAAGCVFGEGSRLGRVAAGHPGGSVQGLSLTVIVFGRNQPIWAKKSWIYEMPHAKILLPAQCRAARGLINWSQGELADRAGVSRSTVKDFETERHALHHSTERLLIEAIEAAGVSLIAGDEAGPGVRFKRPV